MPPGGRGGPPPPDHRAWRSSPCFWAVAGGHSDLAAPWLPWRLPAQPLGTSSCSHRNQGWLLVPLGPYRGGWASLEKATQTAHLLAPKLLGSDLKWDPTPLATPRSHRSLATNLPPISKPGSQPPGGNGRSRKLSLLITKPETPLSRAPKSLSSLLGQGSLPAFQGPTPELWSDPSSCFLYVPESPPKKRETPLLYPHHSHASQELTCVGSPPPYSSGQSDCLYSPHPGPTAQHC